MTAIEDSMFDENGK